MSQCTHEFIGVFFLVDEQTGPKRKELSESKFVVINRSFYLLYVSLGYIDDTNELDSEGRELEVLTTGTLILILVSNSYSGLDKQQLVNYVS